MSVIEHRACIVGDWTYQSESGIYLDNLKTLRASLDYGPIRLNMARDVLDQTIRLEEQRQSCAFRICRECGATSLHAPTCPRLTSNQP